MVFSFSTKESKPLDTEAVKEVKQFCEQRGLSFSNLVVKLLKEYKEEHINGEK